MIFNLCTISQTGSQETSVIGSHNSELGPAEIEPMRGMQLSSQSIPAMSLRHAQRQTSLFFALCTKVCISSPFVFLSFPFLFFFGLLTIIILQQRPSLLRLVFDVYGRAPKVVKQVVILLLCMVHGSVYTVVIWKYYRVAPAKEYVPLCTIVLELDIHKNTYKYLISAFISCSKYQSMPI